MMCAVVVRRLKPDSYEEFRRAWEPLSTTSGRAG